MNSDALVLAPCQATSAREPGLSRPRLHTAGRAAFQIDGIFSIPTEDVPASPTHRASPRGNRSSTSAPLPAGVNPAQGDSVTVRRVSYVVADVRPDR
jgi:hypothetical protein